VKARNAFDGLKNLSGAAAVILSMWTALLTAFGAGDSIVIMLNADGYRPAVCTVDRIVFQRGEARRNRTYDAYYAEVTVEGRREEFNLGDYVRGVPQTREDLEAQVPEGRELAVLYNPDVPGKSRLRVLYPEKDFRESWRNRQRKILRTAYGPWGLAIVLCLTFGVAARRTRSALKWCAGASVFVILAWVPFIVRYLL
jgi:hypothetical protein